MERSGPGVAAAGRIRGAFLRLRLFCIPAFLHCCIVGFPSPASAQTAQATRLLILQAEGRSSPTSKDLALIRTATRSADADTARIAVRALGRFERVSLIPDLFPALRHRLPEVRAEAANALAQAAQGFKAAASGRGTIALTSTQEALSGRLAVEATPSVRAAICEALARLPYRKAEDVSRAEASIVGAAEHATLIDRLGAAEALETMIRLHAAIRPAGARALALLEDFARAASTRTDEDLGRDARVRRLALEALVTANAISGSVLERTVRDPDPQVRRITMRAAATAGADISTIEQGLTDSAPMVRLEALRALGARSLDAACSASLRATFDPDVSVALVAIDQLGACGGSADAVAQLERVAASRAEITMLREWHAHAHALVALAVAAPDLARCLLSDYARSPIWQVRMYAARAAASLRDQATLDTLAGDTDDRVANVALTALGAQPRPARRSEPPPFEPPTSAEIRRLASPRARVTVRGVGQFELALFTTEAPGSVVRFVRLAESGYYNGLSFDRFAPNALAQIGPRAGETATLPFNETSMWPHVRGAVAAARPATNDALFFINLVDNPRFDHQYAVFAQILNGAGVVDRILEGDIIESVDILP